jgi:tripartite-type tricarboxylate transporter receptor subunit TctC
VPYRGAAPATQALVAGQHDFGIYGPAAILPHARSGTVKCYAVTAARRLTIAPEYPSVDEAGLPGMYLSVWHGYWVPKGTPKETIARLNAAIVAALCVQLAFSALHCAQSAGPSMGFSRFFEAELKKDGGPTAGERGPIRPQPSL